MTADTEALRECDHAALTRYVGCGGRSYWICDGCERVIRRGEKEPPAAPAAPWEALGAAVDVVLAKHLYDQAGSAPSPLMEILRRTRAATVPK